MKNLLVISLLLLPSLGFSSETQIAELNGVFHEGKANAGALTVPAVAPAMPVQSIAPAVRVKPEFKVSPSVPAKIGNKLSPLQKVGLCSVLLIGIGLIVFGAFNGPAALLFIGGPGLVMVGLAVALFLGE